MGIFDRWILAKAEKIQASKKEELKIETVTRSVAIEREKKLKSILIDFIEKQAEIKEAEGKIHLKSGDQTVLNYYGIPFDSTNGWDGGVSGLFRNFKEKITKPVTAKIEKVHVNRSFSYELVDRFMDGIKIDWYYPDRELVVIDSFVQWRKQAYSNPVIDIYGLYFEATFVLDDIDFKPVWGLNAYCFLPDTMEEYQITYDCWNEELRIQTEVDELGKKQNDLSERLRLIKSKLKR